MKSKWLITLLSMFLMGTSAWAEEVDLRKELAPSVSEVDPAEITNSYTRKDGAKITEYKSNGRVWMIKVQPPGDFPPYYLYDEEGNGNFRQRIAGNKRPSPPMWIIKRF